jgi:uncharacterized membrane protein/uncharacterized membrane protein YeaQ/YmgE (transglycosylase-associated protein family)
MRRLAACKAACKEPTMHVWQWLITGLAAGLVARLVLTGSRLGFGGDAALGSLGGIASGALLHFAGLTAQGPAWVHVAVALVGAVGMIAAMHILLRTTQEAGRLIKAAVPHELEAKLAALSEREHRVLAKFLGRETVARDAAAVEQDRATLGQRAADHIAAFGGSWAFLGLFAAVLLAWMLYNGETARPFDPFPFILLNLVLSCIAAVQAPVILMSQNRQAERDRLHARLDYEVNLKAEMEILALHEKLDELRERAWRDLLEMQARQLELLEKLGKPPG